MATFVRGLTDLDFIPRLNDEYRKGGWWTRIADDPELFIAIRDNYLNVYYKGASLLMLQHCCGCLQGKTHFKYMVRNELEAGAYLVSKDGRLDLGVHQAKAFLFDHLDHVEGMKRSASRYLGDEKNGVDAIRRSNPNVVDVEVAFSNDDPNASEGSKVPRVDLVAALDAPDGIELVFVEAKLFRNREVRVAGDGDAPVLGQVRGYERELACRGDEIVESYRRICQNLATIEGKALAGTRGTARRVLAARNLKVSTLVRLAVFGFDRDQKNGTTWRPHREKLEAALGRRLILRGDAKGLIIQ